ncbi:Lrp/AsnC family transcriptional regulator [Amycolatopsis vancoresmycina]|uniref:Putative AsnC family transcriptional regulator n=1 Tax=Amycolatopsis vancoresmycina DSM 44592 TaxID=1292037 RepID=R1FVS8_9PSEU|nr:Lrp/AsnC family transcriptional regulator [Amycolatopsis vancoresmycina]EOD63483.1 putative AsnC family transcriptional regulator [Amycolatopsis vancoresmycina DSM 44592]
MQILTEIEQRVVSALQVDGRAGSGRIAEVLDLSPRTVTRVIARLRADGRLKVVCVPDPAHGLRGAMLLRVKILRGRTSAIADALARRDDVLFVDVLAGGEEISAVALGGLDGRLVHDALPSTTAVTELRAHSILRVFSDATQWRTGLLTGAELAALTPPPPGADVPLDDLDRRILDQLAADARLGPAELAVEAPESTVRRRLDRLARAGRIRSYSNIDVRALGLDVDANVWMTVPPGRLDEVGRALAKHPMVHGTLATTGVTNLMAAVWCRDLGGLYRFVTSLDVPSAEVTVVAKAVKRAGRPGSQKI